MNYEEYKKLIEKYKVKEEKKEEKHCVVCNGSGEGMYDGSTCTSCKGLGVKTK
jgi:DnaJ-class molecular chaperone